MRSLKYLFAVGMVALFTCITSAQGEKTAKSGVYTEEQAARGKTAYIDWCAPCHGEELEGAGLTPALTGDVFAANWTAKKVWDLFFVIKTRMPSRNPGMLRDKATAELVAFLLKSNGFGAGAQELPLQESALQEIRISKP